MEHISTIVERVMNDLIAKSIRNSQIDVDEHTCPECGCQNYIAGCACPNCDYTED